MRAILFRAKRVDNGEWVEGFYREYKMPLCWQHEAQKDGINYFIDEKYSNTSNYVLPETVGQYTDMGDNTGKPIFEGDIVVYNTTKYCVGIIYGAYILERINYDYIDYEDFPQNTFPCGCDETEFMGVRHDYCVSLFELSSNEQDFEGTLSCEVIGNRWDNPELLEVKCE